MFGVCVCVCGGGGGYMKQATDTCGCIMTETGLACNTAAAVLQGPPRRLQRQTCAEHVNDSVTVR